MGGYFLLDKVVELVGWMVDGELLVMVFGWWVVGSGWWVVGL